MQYYLFNYLLCFTFALFEASYNWDSQLTLFFWPPSFPYYLHTLLLLPPVHVPEQQSVLPLQLSFNCFRVHTDEVDGAERLQPQPIVGWEVGCRIQERTHNISKSINEMTNIYQKLTYFRSWRKSCWFAGGWWCLWRSGWSSWCRCSCRLFGGCSGWLWSLHKI